MPHSTGGEPAWRGEEVWRTAARFDAQPGSAAVWVTTLAHRRAVDPVRTMQVATERERRSSATSLGTEYGQVLGMTTS